MELLDDGLIDAVEELFEKFISLIFIDKEGVFLFIDSVVYRFF